MSHILLVDDETLFREMVALILRAAGHHVDEAANGDEALGTFQQQHPDLVITDLFMPGRDGLQTILALRRLDPRVRIVAMSGGGKLLRVDCLPMAEVLGARGTLTKPFERAELLNAVDAALIAD